MFPFSCLTASSSQQTRLRPPRAVLSGVRSSLTMKRDVPKLVLRCPDSHRGSTCFIHLLLSSPCLSRRSPSSRQRSCGPCFQVVPWSCDSHSCVDPWPHPGYPQEVPPALLCRATHFWAFSPHASPTVWMWSSCPKPRGRQRSTACAGALVPSCALMPQLFSPWEINHSLYSPEQLVLLRHSCASLKTIYRANAPVL